MRHEGPPPFELVPLSTVPAERWRGLPVFHPMAQCGDGPRWHGDAAEGEEPGWVYDVGVVLEPLEPEPTDGPRVRFLLSNGSTLHYRPDNLWVPVEVLRDGPEPI